MVGLENYFEGERGITNAEKLYRYNLFELSIEEQGGILATCRELGITYVFMPFSFSPNIH